MSLEAPENAISYTDKKRVPYEDQDAPTSSRKRCLPPEQGDNIPPKKARSNSYLSIDDWVKDINSDDRRKSIFSDPDVVPEPPLDINPVPPLSDTPAVDDMPSNAESGAALSDSNGYSDVTNPKDRAKDGSINAYNKSFSDELQKRNIELLMDRDDREPNNIGDLMRSMRTDRKTPEPDQEQYEDIKDAILGALDEPGVMQYSIPELFNTPAIHKNRRLQIFSNAIWETSACIPRPPDALERLVAPKPDYTLGFSKIGWKECKLNTTSTYASPLRKGGCFVPSIALEAKGLKGTLDVAQLQCLHDGATMVWDLYNLHGGAGGTDSDFVDKIKAITFTVTPETVELYYHWAVKADNNQFAVLAKRHGSIVLRDRYVTSFNPGRRTVRNAIDWMIEETKASILALTTTEVTVSAAQAETPPPSNGPRSSISAKRKASQDN